MSRIFFANPISKERRVPYAGGSAAYGGRCYAYIGRFGILFWERLRRMAPDR